MGQHQSEVSQAFGNPAQSFVLMRTQGFKNLLTILISDDPNYAEVPKCI